MERPDDLLFERADEILQTQESEFVPPLVNSNIERAVKRQNSEFDLVKSFSLPQTLNSKDIGEGNK